MKINRVEIDNFMAIGEITVDLENKGLVLIQGENEDDSSQNSNGSGKSTVAEALSWALYNDTARGYTADDVINRTAKKNCRVLVQLVDGDRTYNVIRHRKHSEHKNRVLLLDVTDPLEIVDLTLATDKATDERIVKLVGCSGDVFRAAIYSGQEAQIDLPALTDKHLKTIVEEAAGIDKMQDAYTVARARLSEAQATLTGVNRDIQEQERLVTLFAEQLSEHKTNFTAFETAQKEKVETGRRQLLVLAEEFKALRAQMAEIDVDALKSQEQDIVSRLTSVDGERDAYSLLVQDVNTFANKVSAHTALLNERTRQAHAMKHNMEHSADAIGTSCKECGHVIGASDVEPKQMALKTSLMALVKECKQLKEELIEINTQHDAAQEKMKAFVFTDVSETTAQLLEVRRQLTHYTALSTASSTKATEIKTLKASLEASVTNPHAKLIDDTSKRAKEASEQLAKLNDDKRCATDKVVLQGSVVEVFSPAGIRAQILDTVTPFLNERTARYLGVLSDGNISAVWSTLSKTAKGELREKFEIAVSSRTGGDSYKGLSGGEKKKVRLASALALQDLVSSRASKPIQLWIGDEIDDAVDDSGLERLMTVLEEKAKEKGTVLIISHNPIRDWVRQHVTVKKEGGMATMTGCLCLDREATGV